MDDYNENYLKHGTSEALNKLYCLNLTKQQEREYKAKQKIFHMPFDTSMFTDTDKNKFLGMCNFENTKLKQKHFEQLAQLLLHYKHCYAMSMALDMKISNYGIGYEIFQKNHFGKRTLFREFSLVLYHRAQTLNHSLRMLCQNLCTF